MASTRTQSSVFDLTLINDLCSMKRQPVESNMAVSIGYSRPAGVLEIEFRSGEVWQYHGVPERVYAELLQGSVGKVFQQRVRGKYLEFRIT